MDSTRKETISSVANVLIIVGSIVGVLGIFYYYGQSQSCLCSSPPRNVLVSNGSFTATTGTFEFTLNNPSDMTIISSVQTNQFACVGNFQFVKAGALTSESCLVSSTNSSNFTIGETINFIISLSNGQQVACSVTVQ